MTTFLERLAGDEREIGDGQFKPVARYHREMDFLLYLTEDCSYRADRVDPFLTVLWHPTKEDLVGIKLKGFRYLFELMRSVDPDLEEQDFWPLVDVLRAALVDTMGQAIMDRVEEDRRRILRRRYEDAMTLAKDARIPREELPLAA